MAKKSLTFDIFGRDKSASKALRGVGSTADSMGKKLAGVGRAIGVGLAAAAAGAVAFGVDSVKAFAEAEQSQARLNDAFKRFPKLADTNAKKLGKLNSALAKKTRFDDDATASGQAVLAQFDLTGAQLERITPLMQDYAAKTGKDLPTAAGLLGKAMMGNAKSLKAIGINFKATGDKGKDFDTIVGLLSKKVAGFAEKEGTTAAGKLDILKNRFGEIEEKIGEALMPTLGLLADFIDSDVLPAVEGFSDWFIEAGLPRIKEFVGWLDKNKTVLGYAATAVGVLTAAQWLLNVAMAANPVGAVILGLELLIAEIALVVMNFELLRDTGIDIFAKIGNAGFDAAESISAAFSDVANTIVQPVIDGLNTIRGLLGMEPLKFNVDFGGIIDKSRGNFNKRLDEIRAGLAGDIGLGQNSVVPGRGGGSHGNKVPVVTNPAGKPGASFVQNIYPSQGMSEQTIGSVAANGINRTLRGIG